MREGESPAERLTGSEVFWRTRLSRSFALPVKVLSDWKTDRNVCPTETVERGSP